MGVNVVCILACTDSGNVQCTGADLSTMQANMYPLRHDGKISQWQVQYYYT